MDPHCLRRPPSPSLVPLFPPFPNAWGEGVRWVRGGGGEAGGPGTKVDQGTAADQWDRVRAPIGRPRFLGGLSFRDLTFEFKSSQLLRRRDLAASINVRA